MSIAVVTGDEALFEAVAPCLRAEGFEVERVASDGRLGAGRIAIIDGLSVAESLGRMNPGAHIIAVVDANELPSVELDFADFATKPAKAEELLLRIRALLRHLSGDGDVHARLLAEAVEHAGDIMEITSPSAILQYVNPAFTRILGYPREDVLGRTPAQLVRSEHHSPEYFKNIDTTLSAGKVWHGLLISRSKDGRVVHLETTIAPISDATGKITHHVSVKRDITERVLREQALQETNRALSQARDAALAASKSKSEFLANMSHELRTPLNAVIGYSELLMEEADEQEQPSLKADLAKIRDAGAHLLELINDVLDISKVEAGKMELQLAEFDMNEVLDSVVTTITPLAEKQHNSFTLKWLSPPPPGAMRADRRKLKQVLMNLLSNACRFTENGEVRLDVSIERRKNVDWAVFAVHDTGIGIGEQQREKVFRAFAQADSSTTRKYGGTGLGLSISRHFCEMMGGSIELQSELGKGSTFTAALPLYVAPGSERRSSVPAAAPKILVIDDDMATRDLLQRALSPHGYDVRCASRGNEGLAMALDLRPSLIILDVVMPEMDGWAVLTRLKLESETENIPVVMLTMQDQKELGLTLGAVDYFLKPVKPKQLLAAINRHVTQEAGSLAVLVIEDDDATRELIQRTLEGANHTVFTAANGLLGLQLLEQLEHVNLIVLDLMMPEMDGFQFLEHLRMHPKLQSIPVVVATAKELTQEERVSLEHSTKRIIEKNAYSRGELLQLVERQVTRLLSLPPPPNP